MAPTFKPALVEQIFQSTWAATAASATELIASDSSDEEDLIDSAPLISAASRVRKINADAVKLSTEMLRLFVLEALRRAQMEAMVDDSEQVEPLHIEQILAQLLLDF